MEIHELFSSPPPLFIFLQQVTTISRYVTRWVGKFERAWKFRVKTLFKLVVYFEQKLEIVIKASLVLLYYLLKI